MKLAPKSARRGLTAAVGVLVLADLAGFYAVSQAVKPLTVDQALARYRAQAGGRNGSVVGSVAAPAPATTASGGPRLTAALTGAGGAVRPGATTAGSVGGAGGTSSTAPSPAASPAHAATAAPARPAATSAGPDYAAIALAGPPPGVYVFDTKGTESVSALGGSTHQYPAQTTITNTRGGCGETVRWEPLQERWDQYVLCNTAGGLVIASYTAFHEFFGQVDQRTYQCDPGTYMDPVQHQAGYSYSGNCTSGGGAAAVAVTGRVLGTGTVTVAGTAVPAVHVRIDEVLTGATKGTRSHDLWFALSNEVPLVMDSVTHAQTNTSFGYTNYEEQVSLQLHSLTPMQ